MPFKEAHAARVSLTGFVAPPREPVVSDTGLSIGALVQQKRANSMDDDLLHLRRIAGDRTELEDISLALFHQADSEERRLLGVKDLINALTALDGQLGLALAPSGGADISAMALLWMKRFDWDGDGALDEAEFLEACRWTLLRRVDDLDPPMLQRGEFICSTSRCSPMKGVEGSFDEQQYSPRNKLGEGSFGTVHLVVGRDGSSAAGCERVMKTVNKRQAAENGTPAAELQQEARVMKLLDHPHVVRLFEHFDDEEDMYLVMDVCWGGDLYDFVKMLAKDKRRVEEPWAARCFSQTLQAVAYCHSKGVVHRDIKLENVMLRNRVTVDSPAEAVHAVLVDVGLAQLFGHQHGRASHCKEIVGSLPTMAPEVLRRESGPKCDIYSVGCVLFALLNPHGIWVRSSCQNVLYNYPFFPTPTSSDSSGRTGLLAAQRLGPPMQHLRSSSAVAQQTVRQLLAFEESQRPDALECLRLPWLQRVEEQHDVVLLMDASRVRALTEDRRLRSWQRVVIMRAATQLPASKLAEFEGLFRAIDRSGTGSIDADDLRQLLQGGLGIAAPDNEDAAVAVMSQHDADRSGSIEWTELVAAMIPSSEELLLAALEMEFHRLDRNCRGCLEREAVRTFLKNAQVGQPQSPWGEIAETMLQDLFPGTRDRVTFSEFKATFVDRL